MTEITLRIRPRPAAQAQHLLACADPARLQDAVLALVLAEPAPYTMLFADGAYADMLAAAGFDAPARSTLLLASFQGTAPEVARGRTYIAALDARDLGEAAALHEWQERCYHLRVKRSGPSLLAAEVLLPVGRLAAYLDAVAALAREARTPVGTYGVVVSAREALAMSVYPADARRQVRYLLALGLTKRLQDLGSRCGGRPYGVGLWNTPYLPRLFSRQELADLLARKRRLDPLNLLNPGKLYRAPFPLWPTIFGPAALALAAAHALIGGPRR